MNLKYKIIISMVIIVFLIITGSYLAIRDIQNNILEQEFNEEGHLLANYMASHTSNYLLIDDLIGIKNSFDELKRSDVYIEYIYLTDNEGIVLVHTFEGGFPIGLLNFSKPQQSIKEQLIETDRGTIYEFVAPLYKNVGYIHIGLNKAWVATQLRDASNKMLFFSGVGMVFGGIFIYFMGRWLTNPVKKLTEGANRINKGILDLPIEVSSKDELGELTRSFNEMASNLDLKIKELVRSKDQIEDAEKYLETMFDSVEDGIIVIDNNHIIKKTNKSFLKIMNLKESNVLKKTCHEILYGSRTTEGQDKLCEINTLLNTNQPVRFIHELGTNEDKKIFEINASSFKDKQNSVNIIMVLRDITQQKRLEEDIKDSYEELELTYSKLKELYMVKEHFISNVSHELRTPLTSILGFTELLLEENITDEQRHKLETILRNSKRLARSIQLLLDTAMIDSVNMPLDKKPVLIYDIANKAAEDVKTAASIKNIPINIDIPKEIIIDGDKEKLQQVFLNVIDNSIKFTISGEVTIAGKEENENIHIYINDTGIGIPEDKLESIFERFYQVDSSNKRRFGGIGMGLWISRNFVQAHGGKMWAESKNKGSTFHILLPKMVKK